MLKGSVNWKKLKDEVPKTQDRDEAERRKKGGPQTSRTKGVELETAPKILRGKGNPT
jgi:hypothetical protein